MAIGIDLGKLTPERGGILGVYRSRAPSKCSFCALFQPRDDTRRVYLAPKRCIDPAVGRVYRTDGSWGRSHAFVSDITGAQTRLGPWRVRVGPSQRARVPSARAVVRANAIAVYRLAEPRPDLSNRAPRTSHRIYPPLGRVGDEHQAPLYTRATK